MMGQRACLLFFFPFFFLLERPLAPLCLAPPRALEASLYFKIHAAVFEESGSVSSCVFVPLIVPGNGRHGARKSSSAISANKPSCRRPVVSFEAVLFFFPPPPNECPLDVRRRSGPLSGPYGLYETTMRLSLSWSAFVIERNRERERERESSCGTAADSFAPE